jgi:hypothetical protein
VRHLALVIILAAGCATEDAPDGYSIDLGTPESPIPGTAAYRVTSRIAIPLDVPDVATAIADLRAFSQNGGKVLLARSTGTLARQTLDALPTSLRNNLESWIDIELDKLKIQTVTVRQATAQVASIAESVTTDFRLESSLTISPSGATHSLRNLSFTPVNLDVLIPVGGLNADKITQHTTATVAELGALALGDQKFGLGFGSHAWQAINITTTRLYGGDLSILQTINCDAVARNVAARCVSGSCVGSTAELLTVCQQGMTSLVTRLREELAPVEMDTFRFVSGAGRLVDSTGDGIADTIANGTWQAETDAGMGLRKTSVAFTALD